MFTYNGIDFSAQFKTIEIRRDILPPRSVNLLEVSNRTGAIFTGLKQNSRTIEVDILIKHDSEVELRSAIRNLAAQLNTDVLKPLIFHDEPDLVLYAILDGDTDLEEIRQIGKGTLTFVLPDPFANKTESDFVIPAKPSAIFKRASAAVLADGTVENDDVPRYEPGKFGQGIMVEEGTTNLLPNSDFSDGLADYEIGGDGTATLVNSTRTTGSSLYIDNRTGSETFVRKTIPCTPGAVYTMSAWMNVTDVSLDLYMDFLDAAGNRVDAQSITIPKTNGWERWDFTRTAPANATQIRVWLYSGWLVKGRGYIENVQIENKVRRSSWIRTARAAESMYVPAAGILNAAAGTIELYAYENGGSYFRYLMDTDGSSRFLVARDGSDYVVYFNGNEVLRFPAPAVGFHRVAVRWNGATVAAFLDGVKKQEVTMASAVSFAGTTKLTIGARKSDQEQWNGVIDDLRISSVALTDQQLASYSAVLPVTATSYKFSFDRTLVSEVVQDTTIDVNGTVKPYPVITLDVTAASGELKVLHNSGQFVRLIKPLKAGDRVIFDHKKQLVTVNGVSAMAELDFASDFFALDLGVNDLQVSPAGSASLTLKYESRWT